MAAVDSFNRTWRERFNQYIRDSERRIMNAEKRYSRDIRKLRDIIDTNEKEKKAAEKEYKEGLESVKKELETSTERLRKETEDTCNNIRNQLQHDKEEYDAITREMENMNEELNKTLKDFYHQIDMLKNQREGLIEDLHKDILGTLESMHNRVNNLENNDPRLREHSEWKISDILDAIKDIEEASTKDAWYCWAELVIYRTRLGEYKTRMDGAIKLADKNLKEEKAMAAIRAMIKDYFVLDSGLRIEREAHDPPWGPYKCTVVDISANVYEVEAYRNSFTVSATPNDDYDDDYTRILESELSNDLRRLYENNGHNVQRFGYTQIERFKESTTSPKDDLYLPFTNREVM